MPAHFSHSARRLILLTLIACAFGVAAGAIWTAAHAGDVAPALGWV
jgi:hypothetical protein